MSNRDNSTDIAIQEFLARGGVIQKVAPNVSGRVEGASYSAWGRPKKPAVVEVKEEEIVDEIEIDEDEDVSSVDIVVDEQDQ